MREEFGLLTDAELSRWSGEPAFYSSRAWAELVQWVAAHPPARPPLRPWPSLLARLVPTRPAGRAGRAGLTDRRCLSGPFIHLNRPTGIQPSLTVRVHVLNCILEGAFRAIHRSLESAEPPPVPTWAYHNFLCSHSLRATFH